MTSSGTWLAIEPENRGDDMTEQTNKNNAGGSEDRIEPSVDLRRWTTEFGVTQAYLLAAVHAVGPDPGAVRDYLAEQMQQPEHAAAARGHRVAA